MTTTNKLRQQIKEYNGNLSLTASDSHVSRSVLFYFCIWVLDLKLSVILVPKWNLLRSCLFHVLLPSGCSVAFMVSRQLYLLEQCAWGEWLLRFFVLFFFFVVKASWQTHLWQTASMPVVLKLRGRQTTRWKMWCEFRSDFVIDTLDLSTRTLRGSFYSVIFLFITWGKKLIPITVFDNYPGTD